MQFEEQFKIKALSKAADYFGLIADGQTPPDLDPFAGEMLALAVAGLAGVPVPEPLPDSAMAAPVSRGPAKVGDMIRMVPEAAPLLMAHGWKRTPPQQTLLILSAFLATPGSQWSPQQIVERMPVPTDKNGVAPTLAKMCLKGLLTRVAFGVYTLKTN